MWTTLTKSLRSQVSCGVGTSNLNSMMPAWGIRTDLLCYLPSGVPVVGKQKLKNCPELAPLTLTNRVYALVTSSHVAFPLYDSLPYQPLLFIAYEHNIWHHMQSPIVHMVQVYFLRGITSSIVPWQNDNDWVLLLQKFVLVRNVTTLRTSGSMRKEDMFVSR